MHSATDDLFHAHHLVDGGPVYHETGHGGWIAEPWNSISSLSLILPALYFFILLWKYRKDYGFIVWFFCPLLFVGGMGSTLFHGLRSSPYLLALDAGPMAILTMGLFYYFTQKLTRKHWLWHVFTAAGAWTFLIYLRWLQENHAGIPSKTENPN
ncbi:MAG: hypothetical protein KKA07_07010 [Bacteroidetes bacterium]|nr:hypothetical protein [Bacteroidota bacterium]MBU1718808.1 hypothetical protein [Bacteroidota bacterium]